MTASAPPLPRFDQGVMALALVSGFVFSTPLVIPVVAAVAAVSATRPDVSPVPRLIAALVAQRLRAQPQESQRLATEVGAGADPLRPDSLGYPAPWRAAAALLCALLALGTLALAAAGPGTAWVFGLPAAGLGALASVGGVCVGCELHARRSNRQ